MAFDYRTEYNRYRQYYSNLRKYYQRPPARVSFFVLLSFMTVIFFSVFAIKPTVTTIGELVKEIEEKRRVNDVLAKKIKTLDKIQGLILNRKSDLDKVFFVVPNNYKLGRLTQELEYLAQLTNIQLLDITVGQIEAVATATDSAKAMPIEFSFSLAGTFNEVNEFFASLENLDRIVILNEVEFSSGVSNLQKRGFEIAVEANGETYYL